MRPDLRRNKNKERPNICIITSPRPPAGITPLSNLVDIISPMSSELYLITGNEGGVICRNHKRVHGYSIVYKSKRQVIARIVNYICLQLRISYRLIKLTKNVDTWIFFMAEGLLLPVLTLRLLGRTIILSLAASAPKMVEAKKDVCLVDRILILLEIINYALSSKIVLHSPGLIKEWNLEKYRHKITIAHEYFLDFDKFKIERKFDGGNNIVGYIGRLSEEKGAFAFIKAVSEVLREKGDLEFLIGGDGYLRDEIVKYINEENLSDKIKLLGWIHHDDLPEYLNELRLLVVPSYTESGPLVMLEAMSCGTPVLATPVGMVPDVIKDGETGFILEDTSPECIAGNIMRALTHPNLDGIVRNARTLVERKFTYEKAVERYRKILDEVSEQSK